MKTRFAGKCVFAIAAAMIAAVMSGCGGGGGGGIAGSSTSNTVPAGSRYSLAIHVVDQNNNAVPGAVVTSDSTSGSLTSDGSGNAAFALSSVDDQGTGVRVTIQKAGYEAAFRTVTVLKNSFENGRYNVTLRISAMPATAAEATRAQVALASGGTEQVAPTEANVDGAAVYLSSVTISGDENAVIFTTPAEAGETPDVTFTIGSADGSGPNAASVLGGTGQITASVSYFDPTISESLELFPGDFTTSSDTGNGGGEGVLFTAGFARITLTDASGNPITSFAPGTQAEVRMTVPAGIANPETGEIVKTGDTIPIFVFDEESGEWVVEHNSDGTVKRSTVQQDGAGHMYVTFTTTHLTWFNLDWRGAQCAYETVVRIYVKDSKGNPVNGATVYPQTGGWYDAPKYVADGFIDYWRAPADIAWQVWAVKDGVTSPVLTVNGCGGTYTLTIPSQTQKPACSTDAECDDGKPLTYDRCVMPGQTNSYCTNTACTALCGSDAQCDDGKSNTTDKCENAGTCQAFCSHSTCNAACSSDTMCNDSNPLTLDVCANPGTCQATCSNTSCPVACTSNANCNDSNPNTTDICNGGGTCSAACSHFQSTCSLTLNKVNYAPGETMTITFIGSNAGPEPVLCGAESTLKRGQGETSWNSFTENLYVTIPAFATASILTMTKVVPLDWTGTDTSQGSDYEMYPVHFGGERWASGDNFNLHFKRPRCTSNADCNDNNPATTDTCVNPSLYDATCVNAPCTPACTADGQCDDSNPLTIDVCNSPATCSSACANAPCTPACTADGQCNDSNPLTSDTCGSPNTCDAACVFSPCTPACTSDGQCNDSNPLTSDTCNSPNTCAAACVNTPCTPACTADGQCNDSDPLTNDTCSNPNTCDAVCSFTPCTPACANDTECNDSNPLTSDTCNNPNTCAAACVNAPCTPACATDGQCDDSNPLTIDVCNMPSTCSAACSNSPCSVACSSSGDCSDGNPFTNDSCSNPATCSASCSNPPGQWVEAGVGAASAGGISNTPGNSRYLDIMAGADGLPVVAWSDDGPSYPPDIYVRKWDGTSWAELGFGSATGTGISSTSSSATRPAVAFDASGNPMVAWLETMSPYWQIYLKRWNGSSWVQMGTSASGGGISNTNGTSKNPAIVTDLSGYPIVAWNDNLSGNDEIYLKRWNGTAWVEMGTGSASGGGLSNDSGLDQSVEMATDLNGYPIVVWNSGNTVKLKKWNGSSWDILGNLTVSPAGFQQALTPEVVADSSGNPIITWYGRSSASYSKYGIFVTRWDGSAWVELNGSASGAGISDPSRDSYYPVIEYDPATGYIIVAWRDYTTAYSNIYVKAWTGSQWIEYGPGAAALYGATGNTSGTHASDPGIALGTGGIPFIAWQNYLSTENIFIKRWQQ